MLLPTDNLLFSNTTRIRIDDLSYGKHLCHIKLINLVHNSRALFFKEHSLSEINCFDFATIILKLNVDYIAQAFFDDILKINIYWKENIGGKATIELSYSVVNTRTNTLVAKANTTLGFIDMNKDKLVKIPQEFINLVNKILEKNKLPST
jgi:acyl-CoA thioesterase FadM